MSQETLFVSGPSKTPSIRRGATSSPPSLLMGPGQEKRTHLLCETLTSSVTFQTPEVTKQSWKLKCPEEGEEQ